MAVKALVCAFSLKLIMKEAIILEFKHENEKHSCRHNKMLKDNNVTWCVTEIEILNYICILGTNELTVYKNI